MKLAVPESEMLEKSNYIWMNGKLVPWDDAKVHVAAHALHYASAVFEGIRAYKTEKGTAIFRLGDHIRRLFESAKILMMDVEETTGFSREDIEEAVKLTVRENGLGDAYIRPIVFRDYVEKGNRWGFMGLDPLRCKVSVAIIAFKWEPFARVIRAVTVPYVRPHPMSLSMFVKAAANYLISQQAKIYVDMIQLLAKKAGELEGETYEAVLLDESGRVTEGSGENIFMVKGGKIYTPPITSPILRGITRETIIELAKWEGYTVIERDIFVQELYTADEVFMTGTAAEVVPVVEVDFRKVGDGSSGPVTRRLQSLYHDVVRGRVKEFEHWLSYV